MLRTLAVLLELREEAMSPFGKIRRKVGIAHLRPILQKGLTSRIEVEKRQTMW
jgi:hypothetical protein